MKTRRTAAGTPRRTAAGTPRRITAGALRGEAARFEKPRTEREAAILIAATRVFGEKGYAGARTAEIAAQAGVTERTLFRYFPTKDGLYRRVMFPALLAATMPRELTEAGKLFASDAEDFARWHRRILQMRVELTRAAAPQFRLVIAQLMTDETARRSVIRLWKENLWRSAIAAVRRFQKRGELRRDLPPAAIARAIISLNLGYIVARALLAPEADWDDDAEIEATIELLARGAGASGD